MTSAKKTNAKPSFEQTLHRLEEIVETLEQGDVSLDKSIALYEEGIILSRECSGFLAKADLKIKTLGKSLDGKLELIDIEETE